jgi:hypothetical protein
LVQGRLADAELLYKRALEIYEKALPPGHPDLAQSLNNLAALYCVRHDWMAAANYARRATTTIIIERAKRSAGSSEIGSADTTRRELSDRSSRGDPFGWLVLAAWSLAEQQPSQRATLSEESFIATQWTGQTAAGAALAQMASRLARGEGELSRLVREQQNLIELWQQLDKQIVAAHALPPERRNAAREAELGTGLATTDRQLVALNARLAKDFPEYAGLANPEPLSINDAQNQLRPDEALVLFTDRFA